ncbi:uncharacterized protein LOC129975322 [Argiope bruennichi]|uniref:uncharacterized protein LOC129975322 n=1 Tax=Argiope bruennichi TaxID=94029 RepID=UPI0024956E2C|nr:uncharacterized protein LOC129975322 [Argiope bruennichi]
MDIPEGNKEVVTQQPKVDDVQTSENQDQSPRPISPSSIQVLEEFIYHNYMDIIQAITTRNTMGIWAQALRCHKEETEEYRQMRSKVGRVSFPVGELFNVPIDEITKELKGQGVSQVRRISIRRDGQLLNTKHLVLTFSFNKLPEYIKVGYMRLLVRPYIPNPLRCFKCQRFGYSRTSCRGTPTCARCAEIGHDSSECTSREKCFNCQGTHTSFSRNCPAWQLEKTINSTKIKKQISYSEDRKLVKSQTPVSGTSYSFMIKKPPATDLIQNKRNNILTNNTPESAIVTSLPVDLNSNNVN